MPDASLPELARSLRSLGAARDPATEAAHDAIFAPLIAARVRAARAEGRDVVHSFHGATLLEAIERGVNAAAAAGTEHPAFARARSAAASRRDRAAPGGAPIPRRQRQPPRRRRVAQSPEWDHWIEALRLTFAAADEACGHLARVLAEPPREERNGHWFRRRR